MNKPVPLLGGCSLQKWSESPLNADTPLLNQPGVYKSGGKHISLIGQNPRPPLVFFFFERQELSYVEGFLARGLRPVRSVGVLLRVATPFPVSISRDPDLCRKAKDSGRTANF